MRASTSFPSRPDLSRHSDGAKRETLLATAALSISRLQRWLTDQIIQDIPSDIAVCEYDCRKIQCTSVEWEACESRCAQPHNPLIH